MKFYQFIAEKLPYEKDQPYNEENLQALDIIEYMLLEYADALPSLQEKRLKCFFNGGRPTPFGLDVALGMTGPSSAIEFGLREPKEGIISEEEKNTTLSVFNLVGKRFPESWGSTCRLDIVDPISNQYQTFSAAILLDKDIQQAIESSSLLEAAGDLLNYDLEALFLLKKKLELYKITDDQKFLTLIQSLIQRVDDQILTFNQNSLIEQTSIEAEATKKFVTRCAIAKEKPKINTELSNLLSKLEDLSKKANEENYSDIAIIAQASISSLTTARDAFFNDSSLENLAQLKEACQNVIKQKNEFAVYRQGGQWYNDLNPSLKKLITSITEVLRTLFNIDFQTDSAKKIDTFDAGLFGKKGAFTNLEKQLEEEPLPPSINKI